MSSMIVRHADVLVTMDEQRREIPDGGMIIRDGLVDVVAPTNELPDVTDAEIMDCRGRVVMPGLINTHHHLYQTLTRAVPAAQNANLFDWLKTLYPMWARMTPEAVHASALVGMAELLRSGCTTTNDHLYLYPNGSKIDDEIRAAQEIGIRFHAARGSMSLGESDGGLPPDSVVEAQAAIIADCRRVIEEFHDPNPGAMLRIVVAPCSPFSVTESEMIESAELARSYGVRLHTHLAETLDEDRFCLEMFGKRPLAYAETLDWFGSDVWFAHMVHANNAEIPLLAASGVGVAHCPTSNMRLASGIAPVQKYRAAGVQVGLGVDGSASNDGSHLLAEARQAMLLARLGLAEAERRTDAASAASTQMTAREALELATRGGAAVLGRDDIGQLAPQKCADFFAVDVSGLDFAGALHDPVAGVLFCAPAQAETVVVHGKVVVHEGQVTGVDMGPVIERHNELAQAMVNG